MNPVSKDMKDLLEAAEGTDFVFKTNLFIAVMPTQPVNCVTIYDTSNTPAEGTLDGEDVFLRDSFQIIVRDVSYTNAHALAMKAVNILHGRSNFVLNGASYILINLISGPSALISFGTRNIMGKGESFMSMNFNVQRILD